MVVLNQYLIMTYSPIVLFAYIFKLTFVTNLLRICYRVSSGLK